MCSLQSIISLPSTAKQRYNKRVTAGIKAFLTLDERDMSQVNAFFDTTEEGGWEDLSAAGCEIIEECMLFV